VAWQIEIVGNRQSTFQSDRSQVSNKPLKLDHREKGGDRIMKLMPYKYFDTIITSETVHLRDRKTYITKKNSISEDEEHVV
jgi:hypothetical protein